MTTPSIQTSVIRTVEETTIEVISLGANVGVCRITVRREGPKGGRKTTEVTEEVRHTHKDADKYYGFFYVVEPTLAEHLRFKGWDSDEFSQIHQEKPFTHVLSGKPYAVLRLKTYDNTLYDVDDKPLPVGLHFDYMQGGVDNRNFDLVKLAEHLKKRDDVTSPDDWAMDGIPYYNREPNRQSHLDFMWHPDVRTWRRFVKKVAQKDTYYDRYAAAHAILGNDKFRKKRRDDDDDCCDDCPSCDCDFSED